MHGAVLSRGGYENSARVEDYAVAYLGKLAVVEFGRQGKCICFGRFSAVHDVHVPCGVWNGHAWGPCEV